MDDQAIKELIEAGFRSIHAQFDAMKDLSNEQHKNVDSMLCDIKSRMDKTNHRVDKLEDTRAFKSDVEKIRIRTEEIKQQTSIWRYFQKRPIVFVLSIIIIVLLLELIDIQTLVTIFSKV